MRSFLHRHRRLVTLAGTMVVLFALISANITRYNVPARLSFPEAMVFWVVSPVQRGVAVAASSLRLIWYRHVSRVQLQERCGLLEQRIAHLESRLAELQERAAAGDRLAGLLGFVVNNPQQVKVARVIGYDGGGFKRSLTLDLGARDGVALNMPVITGQGVVGRVIRLHAAFSQALLLTDYNSAVDAVVQRTRDKGVVVGLGGNRCEMKYVDREADVQVGDLVVTSGVGGIFPPGLILGDVVEVQREGTGLFQAVSVRPVVGDDRLEEVLVMMRRTP